MFPIACYQATGQHYAHSALNDRFPAILNAQNPAIPSAHPQHHSMGSSGVAAQRETSARNALHEDDKISHHPSGIQD